MPHRGFTYSGRQRVKIRVNGNVIVKTHNICRHSTRDVEPFVRLRSSSSLVTRLLPFMYAFPQNGGVTAFKPAPGAYEIENWMH